MYTLKNNKYNGLRLIDIIKLLPILLITILIFGCSHSKKNNDHSSWSKENRIASSGKYRTVKMADIDNDGNIDIIGGGTSPSTVAIWYGIGTGEMTEPVFLPIKGDVQSVDIGDFNEDGLKDIIFSVKKELAGIKYWINKPGRKWEEANGPINTNKYQGVRAVDIDNDGHLDIVAANSTSENHSGIQIWLGNGNGDWVVESGPTINGIYMDIDLSDLNNDGIIDIVGSGWGVTGGLRVWLGTGSGGWSTVPTIIEGSFYGLNIDDIDGDGNKDILAGSYRNGAHYFSGDGKGNFIKKISFEDNLSFWAVIPVDLDGDGLKDIIASSIESKGIFVWRNENNNRWSSIKGLKKGINVNSFTEINNPENVKIERIKSLEGLFPQEGTFYEINIEDIDNDGNIDICAASFGEGIKIWLGNRDLPLATYNKKELQKKITIDRKKHIDLKENLSFTTRTGFSEYIIGSGDIIEITLWKGSVAQRDEIKVRPDGEISFGFIDDLKVHGLTPSELDTIITDGLKEYIKNPRVEIQIKEFKSKYVNLMGEIGSDSGGRRGGKFPLTGKVKILDMITKHGGFRTNANRNSVKVKKRNGNIITLNLNKAIHEGDETQNIILDDGDLVFIPALTKSSNRVYVFGEVKKPGIYSFNDSEISILDAVTRAGGVTIFATEESTKVVRGDITRPEVLSSNLESLIEKGDHAQNLSLTNGDLVYVPRSFIGDINLFVRRIRPIIQLIKVPVDILETPKDIRDSITESDDAIKLDRYEWEKKYQD
jgi:protein involved in polysaccharide export with SLBB domain